MLKKQVFTGCVIPYKKKYEYSSKRLLHINKNKQHLSTDDILTSLVLLAIKNCINNYKINCIIGIHYTYTYYASEYKSIH